MKKTVALVLPYVLAALGAVAIMAAACGRPSAILPASATLAVFGVLALFFRGLLGFVALAWTALGAWLDNRRAWRGLVEAERRRAPCSCALPSAPFAAQDGRLFCLLCRREARPEASR